VTSVGTPGIWVVFGLLIVAMLALDMGVFHRKAHVVKTSEAAIWTVVWIALALGFNGYVAWRFGADAGQAFLTGYIIEKALSVDNLFVFYMIFSAFKVPDAHQHRLLFWGIGGALALRTGMVFGGTWLLSRFTFRALSSIIPTTARPADGHLFLREDGRLKATSLFLVLILIELSDIVFAIDSILAIFAVTSDPFIVLTSNVFAIMGMRSLYFLLASMARRFIYLQPGLALVIIFVGVKMAIAQWLHIPVALSLAVVLFLLGTSIVASLIRTRRRDLSVQPR
jgi:tellurite resistance protein TerC